MRWPRRYTEADTGDGNRTLPIDEVQVGVYGRVQTQRHSFASYLFYLIFEWPRIKQEQHQIVKGRLRLQSELVCHENGVFQLSQLPVGLLRLVQT